MKPARKAIDICGYFEFYFSHYFTHLAGHHTVLNRQNCPLPETAKTYFGGCYIKYGYNFTQGDGKGKPILKKNNNMKSLDLIFVYHLCEWLN